MPAGVGAFWMPTDASLQVAPRAQSGTEGGITKLRVPLCSGDPYDV